MSKTLVESINRAMAAEIDAAYRAEELIEIRTFSGHILELARVVGAAVEGHVYVFERTFPAFGGRGGTTFRVVIRVDRIESVVRLK